jgi:hypothetical protein
VLSLGKRSGFPSAGSGQAFFSLWNDTRSRERRQRDRMTEGKRRSIASPFENTQERLRSVDFAQDDTKKRIRDSSLRSRMTQGGGAARNLEFGPSLDASKTMRRPLSDREVPRARGYDALRARSFAALRMTIQLDAETRNRYRLRFREAVRGPSA